MTGLNEVMTKVINKCDLLLEGDVFSGELLLRTFAKFLTVSVEKDKHNVGLVLHTGSLLFDAVAISFAAVSNMILNDMSGEDLVWSLELGDSVLYGEKKKNRCTFEGIVPMPHNPAEDAALLDEGPNGRTYVPKGRWRFIFPYYGDSKQFGGRGIRKISGVREDFYKEVLGFEDLDIPSIIDTSTVVVISRERADRLINGLSVRFGNKEAKILELVTASYYTENDEYFYEGNASKAEPVLKLTGKMSVGRKQLLSKNGNRNIGLIVLGDDMISRGITELPELINRKSIQYVFVSAHIDSEHGSFLLSECENANLFACTKDFLVSNSLKAKDSNILIRELSKQVDVIIDRDIEPVILEGLFSWSQYRDFKKAMFTIKNSDFDAPEKEAFIINAYSLMNLLLTAVFKITELETAISEGKIDSISPEERLKQLLADSKNFPAHLMDKCNYVVDLLETAYLSLLEKSEKEYFVREFLSEHHSHKIAIIVPKAYYATILRRMGYYSLMDKEQLLFITTANKFDNTRLYDEIICVGDFEGKRYSPFRCRASSRIITLLYGFELNLFKHKMKQAVKIEEQFNSHCVINYAFDSDYGIYYDDNANSNEIEEIAEINAAVDEYVQHLNDIVDMRSYAFPGESFGSMSEIVAIASFESGEKAFFTKMYKAYVLDEIGGEVNEIDVKELNEGDLIVFTQKNQDTRDIVDGVLRTLIEGQKLTSDIVECYEKSKRWKKELIDYMKVSESTVKTIAKKMIGNGVAVQEITIRSWLDEDSHTVGPRNKDSIEQIALLVEDDEMFEKYEEFFEACVTIRKIRREILKTIGEAIIQKVSGKVPEVGTLIADIHDKISSLAIVLRLESISYVSKTVSMNATNRPIRIKE